MTHESPNARSVAVILLAAGKGTRMHSDLPKVLHPIAGAPMLHHAMRAAQSLSPRRFAVVVGHGGEKVAAAAQALVPDAMVCEQAEQLGTGHAVRMAEAALGGFEGDALVLFGDTPFIAPETLAEMVAARVGSDLVALGFEAAEPGRYGRMVIREGRLERIVEAKDATPEELAITICNSGVILADCATLFRLLAAVGNANAQGEYYLTDVIGLACGDGLLCRAVLCSEAETLGINDRVQLAGAEAIFQARARRVAMLGGATLVAPDSVHFAFDTALGRDVTIEPNVVFGPGVRVADRATIRAFCHLEQCTISDGAAVGPFARLRGGTVLGEGAYVGNFVEMKNADFGPGAKASHLSYVGDASVGAKANIGAGTITCNYDGVGKHRTMIGAGAFIGSNSALVAPLVIGDGAFVGSGSVITEDVPGDALAIGRARQVTKPGLAARLREKFKAAKAARKQG